MLDKSELRSHFKDLKKNLKEDSFEFRQSNSALNANLRTLLKDLCPNPSLVLSFSGFGSEPKIDRFGEHHWALPKIYPDHTLKFFKTESSTPLVKNHFGILEPDDSSAREVRGEDALAVIVPGLAFDQNGMRLGLGKGYYDRFLNPLPQLSRIGVCFSFQLSTMDLPKEDWDEPMNWLVTELGVIRFQRKGS